METQARKTYLDMIRIIAVFLVIFNHLDGYSLYQTSSGGKTWFYMILSIITRINVPLFFMVSGSLLLGKTDDYKTVFMKRFLRFAAVLIVFTSIYVIMRSIVRDDYKITLVQYVYKLITGEYDYLAPYWFLYSYLGFVLMLPFMQRIAKGFSGQDFCLLIGLRFILLSLLPMLTPIIYKITGKDLYISSSFSVPLAVEKVFFYALIGYYLDRCIDITKLNHKKRIFLYAFAIIGMILSAFFTYYEGSVTGTFTQYYLSLFDYIIAIAVFIFIKHLFVVRVPWLSFGKFASVICVSGALTFGIYLLDPFLKTCFYNRYVDTVGAYISVLPRSLGWCIISMIICGLITYLLKKLPGFRKLL